MSFVKNGAAVIQRMIDEAKGTVTVSGKYEIEKAILIPSDFHLILDNCYLRMADNTFCNMFSNKNCRVKNTPDKNIVIEGRGNTVLDGGEYNGLSERNAKTDGRPEIWENNVMLFADVRGFKITNLRIINQRWWAMNFIACKNGYIGNIDFCSDDTYLDENGGIKHGLDFGNYEAIRIKNSDGIDIRRGCRDIIIENITGFTEDDTVALTSLPWRVENEFCPDGESTDICNIVIRNVMSSALCSNVRLLCQGDGKMYNILVDGVVDTSKESSHMTRGIYAVRVGDAHAYNDKKPLAENFYNITVRNVISRASCAVEINHPIGKYSVDNIMTFDGCNKDLEIVE